MEGSSIFGSLLDVTLTCFMCFFLSKLPRTAVSPDGMHFCSSTSGPRTAGGFVCLTKCILAKENANRRGENRAKQYSDLQLCQDRCNSLFMNMDSSYADGYVHLFGERPGVDLEKDVTAIER